MFDEKAKKELLGIARSAIESCLSTGPDCGADTDPPDPEAGPLSEARGVFVSLHENGRLRGCIGTLTTDEPLYMTVGEMAVSAATRDPRFMPVRPEETASITIEISVLTPFREVHGPNEIEAGRHGILIMKGQRSGLLLPQVATEYGFDSETFLDETCQKAGLSPGAWKEGAKIFTFEAEVFRED